MMNPVLALMMTTMVKGTDAEAGIAALLKLDSGFGLVDADHLAIGRALEVAAKRMAPPPPPPAPPPPRPSIPTLPEGVVINRGPPAGNVG